MGNANGKGLRFPACNVIECYRTSGDIGQKWPILYIMVSTAYTHGAFDACTKICPGSDSGHSPHMWDMAK